MKNKPNISLLLGLVCCCLGANAFAQQGVTPAFPKMAEEEAITASLRAIERRGHNLSGPITFAHRVECLAEDVCDEVIAWANANNFSPSETVTVFGHGGMHQYYVELTRTHVPNAARIRAAGKRIHAGMSEIEGANYLTWQPNVGRGRAPGGSQ